MSLVQVIKRDGSREPLNIEKLHKVTMEACEGLTGVSASQVELAANPQFYNGIKTTDIQETLIKAAADLITEETPNYQYVAGRLINYHLRKEVYGQYQPRPLLEVVRRVVEAGFYDKAILKYYDEDEFQQLDNMINHGRDENLTYVAMEQYRGKYLVKDRTSGKYFETPQIALILIAATLFASYPKETRMKWIKEYYDAISNHDLSLPTPVMAGVRTPVRQYSSCILVDCGDSLDSINATVASIVRYVSARAGIGINVGRMRSLGSSIRGGQAYHTGVIPFIKLMQAAVKSCSQGSVRGGAATVFFPFFHHEVQDIIVLKNNKGTEDNRARHLDYAIQMNNFMYRRAIKGENITLFSPADVPDLYQAFYTDQEKFQTLYEKYERSRSIRKTVISARELLEQVVQERKETGRLYLMNVDHCNDHGPYLPTAPIYMSNLCVEITHPTTPLNDVNDPEGEIGQCTLSAINMGNIREPSDFKRVCELAVRGLDALLTYQDYPVLAAENAALNRRQLGVGLINFAYWLAKNDLSYSDPAALELVDEYAEAWSFYLIQASVDLAEEQGACEGIDDSKYGEGIFPIDTYNKNVDKLVKRKLTMPWDKLRARAKRFGIRNSSLMALMPSETSSQVSNSTNGIEPPRALISIKQSKDGVLRQVVPEIRRLKNKYELLWDMKSPRGYLNICAVLQKYIDQSISVNTSYNPAHYQGGKIPLSELVGDVFYMAKFGIKTAYYSNTHDGGGEFEETSDLPASEPQEEICDSCAI